MRARDPRSFRMWLATYEDDCTMVVAVTLTLAASTTAPDVSMRDPVSSLVVDPRSCLARESASSQPPALVRRLLLLPRGDVK